MPAQGGLHEPSTCQGAANKLQRSKHAYIWCLIIHGGKAATRRPVNNPEVKDKGCNCLRGCAATTWRGLQGVRGVYAVRKEAHGVHGVILGQLKQVVQRVQASAAHNARPHLASTSGSTVVAPKRLSHLCWPAMLQTPLLQDSRHAEALTQRRDVRAVNNYAPPLLAICTHTNSHF